MRMSHACLLATLLLVALFTPVSSHAYEKPTGNCISPYDALIQVVHPIITSDLEDHFADDCMDTSELSNPGKEGPRRAEQLLRVLDANGLEVKPEASCPNLEDDATKCTPFQALPDLVLLKVGNKWLISKDSVAAIPALYKESVPFDLDDWVNALPEWLQKPFLGIALWQVIGLVIFFLLALVLQKLVVYFFARWLRHIKKEWVRDAIDAIHKPVGGLTMAGVFSLALPLLHFPLTLHNLGMLSVQVLAAFSLVWLGYRLIDVLANILDRRAAQTETKLDDQLVPIVRKSLKLAVSIIGTVFILQNLNVDVGSLLAGLGLGGLAFALAAQDTVANFFGSIMIFIDKPFHVGDWIKMGNEVEGTVEEVGFRTTRVRTFYNSVLTVPNARVTDSCIDNLGARQYRRYKANLSLTYDTPPAKISAFCEGVRQLIQALPGMRKDFYLVEFNEFGDSGLNIMIYSFMHTPDWDTELRVRTNFNLGILQLAEDLGVEFAFPTRTLHMDSMAPAQNRKPMAREEFTADELNRVVAEYGPGGARYSGLTVSDAEGHITQQGLRGEADG